MRARVGGRNYADIKTLISLTTLTTEPACHPNFLRPSRVASFLPKGGDYDDAMVPSWPSAPAQLPDVVQANIAGYEQSVKWHLDLIRRSQTGQALLSAIQRTDKRVTIKPFFSTPKDTFNAYAMTTFFGNFQIRYTSTIWASAAQRHRAATHNSRPGSPATHRAPFSSVKMAHTYREMRETFSARRTTQPGYENQEEFFAILMSNIFVTDPTTQARVRTLRADHGGFALLAAPQQTSQEFFQVLENRLLVAQHG
jgi:hypothetical protein